MLIGVYLLIPITRKIASDERVLQYAVVVWLLFISANFFIVWNDLVQIKPLLKMNAIVGYAGYFLLAYWLSQYKMTRKQRYGLYLVGILASIACIVGNIAWPIYKGEIDRKFSDNLSPLTIAMTTALFLFFKEKSNWIQSHIIGFVQYVRKDIFGIYLTHPIWLNIIRPHEFLNTYSPAVQIPVTIIITFIFSLLTTKLIRLIPCLREIVE